jgi:CHAD domain-containing protein
LADLPLLPVTGERTAAQLATARISRGYHRILRPGKAITPTSPAEDLHELRKRCKELRYVLEFFASLHPPDAHRAMIKELKSLQDCLGRFQDSQIQREAITFHTEQLAGESSVAPTTLDAMEQLAARLATQQHLARHEFAGRFKRFASPKTIGLLMALAEPPPG